MIQTISQGELDIRGSDESVMFVAGFRMRDEESLKRSILM
jgi:hypothetical protein